MDRGIKREDDKVWVSVEATINLGNYENIKIAAGRSRTILPKEDDEEIREEMMETMITEVLSQGEAVRTKKNRR